MRLSLRGLLVDMDGTLLDSEKLWDIALVDVATWLGGTLSNRARQHMVGTSLARAIAILHDDLGIDADPESSSAYLLERAEELFRTDLVWKPGAPQLLHAAKAAAVPTALVTSTHRRLADVALEFMGRTLFAASVCGDEVAHPKPAPDPYVLAAARLGVAATRCIAIEDSPVGVTSAEAAGCTVLAVPSEIPIPATPTRAVWPSLEGVTIETLSRLVGGAAEAR
ncbi:MAG: HAD family phosphatase [Chloroflexi bacterium]|nr:HAD family phosphatase [Chloroflexota bacterium]